MNDDDLLRYSRHILLPEIGIEGQERLRVARLLVIGAGGLGSPAALYLATAGVGHLTLVDDDRVDLTNLQRQVLHRMESIGVPKALSGQTTLAAYNPGVVVSALVERANPARLEELVGAHDIVLDCCDNFATRHAVNRACVKLKKPLVSGAAIRFDGQLTVFDARQDGAPCYHCLFPEGEDVDETRCAVMGVFAPLTGIIGTMQAAEALKLAAGVGEPLLGKLLLLDGLAMRWREVRYRRDVECAVCKAPTA
ncbi:MAG: molybdopterin-synthase adenylyltransferase MoeB [Burkholderiales bacterium]|nr:molybdopterin-synthase adenylyltransferase MoeB [Burkholderiales bacterium]